MIPRFNHRLSLLPALGFAIALTGIASCNSNPGPDSISSHGPYQAGTVSDCGLCHSIALSARRAVMGANGDFGANPGRASHHVVGPADPTTAQCLQCHNIDQHGSGTVRLINADTGAVIPATTNANMETFCLSCHDANGANGNMSPFADGRTLGSTYAVDTASRPPAHNEIATVGWTDPNNAHADDGISATASPAQNAVIESRWGNFGFDSVLPQRIERGRLNSVRIVVQYRVDTQASIAQLNAQATVGGVDCPTTPRYHATEPTADTVVTFDVTSCRNWTMNDLLDANFKVKLGASRGDSPTPVTFFLDYVRVEATYNGTSYIMGTRIQESWSNTAYGHRQQGLTCIGSGNPNTGCHQNAHGSQYAGILAKNLRLPAITPPYTTAHESNYELCFSCHASYPAVSKEAILGVRAGSLYDNDHGKGGTNRPPYSVPEISTLFRDMNAQFSLQPYDDPVIFSPAYVNLHYYHLQAGIWEYRDVVSSGIHCLSCHDVHGSDTQWGWLHDTMLFDHASGSALDAYGIMNASMASLDNFPTSCRGFNCHDIFGTTHAWFTPLADDLTRLTVHPTTNEIVTTGWTSPANAHADDGAYATAAPALNATVASRWGFFGLDSLVPPSAQRIVSVRIVTKYKVDTKASVAGLLAQAVVNGIDCPPVPQTHTTEPLTDAVVTFNVTGCRTWTRDDLLDANFNVLIGASRGNSATAVSFSLDYVRVDVSYY